MTYKNGVATETTYILVLAADGGAGQLEPRGELLRHVQVAALQPHGEDERAQALHLDGVTLAGPHRHRRVHGLRLAEQVQHHGLAVGRQAGAELEMEIRRMRNLRNSLSVKNISV